MRDQLLELLRERAFERREVVLSSGKKSNFYIDCKKVTLTNVGAWLVANWILFELDRLDVLVDAVGGPELGAVPIAAAVSVLSYPTRGLDMFVVRHQGKDHGSNLLVEGARPGMSVVIVEDVVTSGASTLRAIAAAREAGLRVVHAYALVDRLEGGSIAIKAEVPFTALFTREDFL